VKLVVPAERGIRLARPGAASLLARARVCVCACALTELGCSSSSGPPPLGTSNGDAGLHLDGSTDAAADVDGDAASEASGPANRAIALAMGQHHTCALTTQGGVRCWGDNSVGQLGDGTTTQRLTPVDVVGLTSGVTAIAAGDQHTCAIVADGGVECWGSNLSGALGDGTAAMQRSTPGPVADLSAGVVAIGAGGADTCAALASGSLYCWGLNASGQLGDGTYTSRTTPTVASGLTGPVQGTAGSIAPGGDHTCVVLATGDVQCTGADVAGQLGNGQTDGTNTFVANGLANPAVTVASALSVSCAIDDVAQVSCWGSAANGGLGIGAVTDQDTPQRIVVLSGVTAIAGGANHWCAAVRADAGMAASVFCWGNGQAGALGDDAATSQNMPVAVTGLPPDIVGLGAGTGSCAISAEGAVYCWGANTNGEVGDGTTVERDAPVVVTGL
jgi:alpha-tubulin suppressor-like RCC1 family protein